MSHWVYSVIFVAAALLLCTGVDILFRSEDAADIRRVIEGNFTGRPSDLPDVILNNGMTSDRLMQPLTKDTLRRMRSCVQVRNAWVQTKLRYPLTLPGGVAVVDVAYEFEGIEPDGALLTVSENGRLRIHFGRAEYRGTLVVYDVELVQR